MGRLQPLSKVYFSGKFELLCHDSEGLLAARSSPWSVSLSSVPYTLL